MQNPPARASCVQESLDALAERVQIFGFALPNNQYAPAHLAEPLFLLFISHLVASEFRNPIILIRTRETISLRAVVLVPKTSVDEDHLASAGKGQIRAAGQIFAMEPIAVPHAVRQTAHDHFQARILALDRLHDATPHFRSFRGRHSSLRSSVAFRSGASRGSLFALGLLGRIAIAGQRRAHFLVKGKEMFHSLPFRVKSRASV